MELNEFIKNTLIEIAEGVKAAGEAYHEMGGKVPHYEYKNNEYGDLLKNQKVVNVDFEVALANSSNGSDTKGIGVALSVLRVGASSSQSSNDESLTKIKFTIPITLPLFNPKT